ncbi:LytR/AlgR family response regulator transcription factor [Fibrella aquatilis]|uniref:Response regulator n=1 Tax=Fibrella aquatilis TaxID=2817059 RepID=A0A939G4U2_9BACT|nr:response regulator [Fibrella aquatilis]MBO0929808.1 response regulator [Fibrella aquatilis]
MLRTLLIDDENPSLDKLEKLLAHYCSTTVQVVGRCQTVESALLAIDTQQPDLVFLDVHLGDRTGFDLLAGVPDITFDVVFSTAYDTYALRAFQANAVDYLLKPIDPDRLRKAVEKVQSRSVHDRTEYRQQIIQSVDNQQRRVGKVSIPVGSGRVYIAVGDIEYCQTDTERGCLNLYGLREKKMVENELGLKEIKLVDNVLGRLTHTLDEFEKSLNDPAFCRIHESRLINLTYLKEYINGRGGTVIMTDGTELIVSDRHKANFKRRTQLGSF